MSDFPERVPYDETAAAAQQRLNAATEQLIQLLRSGNTDLQTARELGTLRAEVQEASNLLIAAVMHARARIAMDAHVIGQMSFERLGTELNVSSNTPSLWRQEAGPSFYAIIFRDEHGNYVLDKEEPRRREVARRVTAGAVVVPAAMKLDLLSEEELAALDLAALYEFLKNGGHRAS